MMDDGGLVPSFGIHTRGVVTKMVSNSRTDAAPTCTHESNEDNAGYRTEIVEGQKVDFLVLTMLIKAIHNNKGRVEILASSALGAFIAASTDLLLKRGASSSRTIETVMSEAFGLGYKPIGDCHGNV